MSQNEDSAAPEGIAITGLALRFPGASDPDQFWNNLAAGVDSITRLTDEDLIAAGVEPETFGQSDYVRAASIIEDIDRFDADFFDITPREAEILDPQQRLLLETSWRALESAGHDPQSFKRPIGFYAGGRISDYFLYNLLSNPQIIDAVGPLQIFFGNDKDYLTTFVSYKLGLSGPSIAVQTACSSALVAVHLACESLLSWQCDMALAGGVSVRLPGKEGYVYHEGGLLAPDGHCRSFDARAAGTVFGSGVGVVVLRRLADALEDGDPIRAVILGSAVNNDGAAKVGFSAPGEEGQAGVITEALSVAGVEAESISLVEGHGSGTALGDPVEVAALTRAFGGSSDRRDFCALGSVKSNLGHLESAAGVAGLVKTVLALEHRTLPASVHFEKPNPRIDFAAGPFRVVSETRPWESTDGPRRAGVSSFGLGGTNAHTVLEEAPARGPSGPSRPWQILPLSARDGDALDRITDNLAGHLENHPEQELADVAYTLQVGRRAFEYRRLLLCQDREDALRCLKSRDPVRLSEGSVPGGRRSVAFMFPGLGEHYPGMARELFEQEEVFRRELERCAEILRPLLDRELLELLYPESRGEEASDGGVDLRRMLGRGPAVEMGELERTEIAHPTVFALEYALARLWQSWGVEPQAMIGYSLGEYVAACLAGVFSLEDALWLVVERARLISRLPAGVMLAVPLGEVELRLLAGEDLDLAAINSHEDCVVAGGEEAVAALEAKLAERDVVSRRLSTSHPFHSRLLEPMAEEFARALGSVSLREPEIPFVSGVSGTWIEAEQATDPDWWVRHTLSTVRFADGLGELLEDPARVLLEVGPGQSLGVVARRYPQREPQQAVVTSIRHIDYRQSDTAFLLSALGQLWLAGVEVAWPALNRGEGRRRVPLPTYPFARQRHWIEPRPLGVAAPARGLEATPERTPADWIYSVGWRQGVATPPSPSDAESWLLLSDGGLLARRFAEALEGLGRRVAVALAADQEEFDRREDGTLLLRPESREHHLALLSALRAEGREPEVIVHFWSLPASDGPDQELARGFESLIALAQGLGEARLGPQVLVVTEGGAVVTGEEAWRPLQATLLGPVRSVPQEYPDVRCRLIDLLPPRDAEQADRLVDRLLREPNLAGEPWVAYRGTFRFLPHCQRAPLEEVPVTGGLRTGGVYLITGGLGGLGLILARELAQAVQARLVLVARTPLPPRDAWDAVLADPEAEQGIRQKILAIRDCETAGAEVLVESADLGDLPSMRSVVERAVERFGALHGVFHAAGVAGGGLVQLQTHDTTRPVLLPKVDGTAVLREILTPQALDPGGFAEPDFVVLFSSILSYLGGIGQVAYCAANAVLDATAARQSPSSTRWVSVAWDRWLEVGMAAAEVGETGGEGIPPGLGAKILLRILAQPTPSRMVVSVSPFPELMRRVEEDPAQAGDLILVSGGSRDFPAASRGRPALANPYVAPRSELETGLAKLWGKLLGISEVGIHDNFFQLGGDSVRGLQLTVLARRYDLRLSIGELFEYPTIAALAEHLENVGGRTDAVPAVPEVESPPSGGLDEVALERIGVDEAELAELAELYGDPDE